MNAIFTNTMGRRTADVPLSKLDDVLLAADTTYRKLWYGSVLARTIGIAVLTYRSDHALTQAALGKLVGMTQPQVARIEDGEHNPSLETMTRLCDALGLELTLTIGPKQTERRVVPKALQRGVHDATDQVVVSVRER